MRHGVLPQTLHVDEPSPQVDWSAGAVELLTEAAAVAGRPGRPRRAGVSSFGISGTNAHVILEEAAGRATSGAAGRGASVPASGAVVPLVVSAGRRRRLRAQAARLAAPAGAARAGSRRMSAYSLVTTAGAARASGGGGRRDRDELLAALARSRRVGAGRRVGGPAGRRRSCSVHRSGVAAGGMGLELYAAFPVFAEAFDAVVRGAGRELGPVAARGDLPSDAGGAAGPDASTRSRRCSRSRSRCSGWSSRGACARTAWSGIRSVRSRRRTWPGCCRWRTRRAGRGAGRLMQALPAGGAMVAVGPPRRRSSAAADATACRVAAVNGPRRWCCPVTRTRSRRSGCGERRESKRLRVSHAFHSPLMEPMLAEFAQVAAALTYASRGSRWCRT